MLRRSSAILAVVLSLLAESDGFLAPMGAPIHGIENVARAPLLRSQRIRSHVSTRTVMLVEPKGSDAFVQLEEEVEGNRIRSALRKMGPKVARAVSTGIVPAAAVVGFLAMPGGAAVSAVGAAVSTLAGNVARKKIGDEARATAPAAVADLFAQKGVSNVNPADVQNLLSFYGLDAEETESVVVDVYQRYLIAMCKGSMCHTSDIRELSDLRRALGLTGEQLGMAHYAASTSIYRERVLFTPSEELKDRYNPNRKAVDKFIFLSDRLFEVCDTEEAYEYEMQRIRKVFDLEPADIKLRCSQIATPFYEKAVSLAVSRLENLKEGALRSAQKTLGVPDTKRDQVHAKAFRNDVIEQLKAGGGSAFNEGVETRFEKLGSALGLSPDQQRQEMETVTLPVYERAVAESLEQALAKSGGEEEVKRASAMRYGRLIGLQMSLKLAPESASRSLISKVRDTAGMHVVAASKFVKAGNSAKAVEAAKELLQFVRGATSLVERDETDEIAAASKVFNRVSLFEGSNAGGPLYKLFLSHTIGAGDVTDQDTQDLKLLAKLTGLSPAEVQRAYRDGVGAELKEALAKSIEDSTYTQEAKSANADLVKRLNVPKPVVQETCRELYVAKLQEFCDGGRILNEAQKQELNQLRDFLDVDQEAVDKFHMQVCSPAYQQSLLESMGSTGVISEDLLEPLDRLRQRLGLSVEHARALLYNAAKIRMKPMIDVILYEFERTVLTKEQFAQRRGSDLGDDVLVRGQDAGDLGISETGASVWSEVLALVDFYRENKLLEFGDDNTFRYPVTVEGYGNPLIFEKIFQQFLVAGFTKQEGEEAQRYLSAQPVIAGIFNLAPERIRLVQSELGGTVLQQFFGSQLAGEKTSIDARGTAFLAQVSQKLGMQQKDFSDLVRKAKAKVLRGRSDAALARATLTAENARYLRDLAAGLDLDFAVDSGLSKEKRIQVFLAEARAAVEKGGDALGDIPEAAEAFGLGEAEAQRVLGGLLKDRATIAAKEAGMGADKRDDKRILSNVDMLLRYCRVAGGLKTGATLSQQAKAEIFNTFMASRSGSDEEMLAADAELLREAIDFKG